MQNFEGAGRGGRGGGDGRGGYAGGDRGGFGRGGYNRGGGGRGYSQGRGYRSQGYRGRGRGYRGQRGGFYRGGGRGRGPFQGQARGGGQVGHRVQGVQGNQGHEEDQGDQGDQEDQGYQGEGGVGSQVYSSGRDNVQDEAFVSRLKPEKSRGYSSTLMTQEDFPELVKKLNKGQAKRDYDPWGQEVGLTDRTNPQQQNVAHHRSGHVAFQGQPKLVEPIISSFMRAEAIDSENDEVHFTMTKVSKKRKLRQLGVTPAEDSREGYVEDLDERDPKRRETSQDLADDPLYDPNEMDYEQDGEPGMRLRH